MKLYVDEPGRAGILQTLADADLVATSVVTYAEARAAFARRRRAGGLSSAVFKAARRDFDVDWSAYFIVDVTRTVCRSAGELAEEYHLRGFDGIHLASFLELARAGGPDEVQFSSFDSRLNRAAAAVLRSLKRGR